jgi:hypothetical protein
MKTQNVSSMQRIMHFVLTGRMLLHLRQYERRNVHGDGMSEFIGMSIPMEFMGNNISTSDDGPEYL